MSRPPIPFKSADGPVETDPFRRAATSASSGDRPRAHTGPESLTIHEIRGSAEALEAFATESELPTVLKQPVRTGRPGVFAITAALALVMAILGLTFVALQRSRSEPTITTVAGSAAAAASTGVAQFDSRPAGAEVVIDGVVRGKTPLKLSLAVGDHALEIKSEAGTRSLPLTIEAGTLVSQYVELLAAPEHPTGRLDVSSDPPGAQVRVDGVAKGVTPLTLEGVAPGDHNVSLSRNGVTIVRSVKVAPGTTGSVVASLSAAAPESVGGWIALNAPFELQVFEDGRLIGTTATDRLMVPAGRHQLEVVNAAFQFRARLAVDVQAGKVAATTVPLPNGALSVNALPWAEVSIDGRSVGTTPLANLPVTIGSHEVVLRHPQLGERSRTVTITAQAPVRIGVDFGQ